MPQLALPLQMRTTGDRKSQADRARPIATPRLLAQALEPRVMLDAAALATVGEYVTSEPSTDDFSAVEGEQLLAPYAPALASEIVFIDSGIDNWQLLLLDLPGDAEVVMLDPSQNGLEQIADHLAQRSNLSAIHIITHGSEATAFIGGTQLGLDNVDTYAAVLGAIGAALSESGDILFYGCDIAAGENGAALVARIAALTGADIAASTDLTGAQDLGGDWTLEIASGEIEAQLVVGLEAQAAFGGLLAFTQESGGSNPMDAISASLGAGSVFVSADVTGDGLDDIIGRGTDPTRVVFWQNNGDGTWTNQVGAANPFNAIVLDGTAGSFTVGRVIALDIDSDGDIDLYNYNGNAFWRNDGASFTVLPSGSNPLSAIGSLAAASSFISADFTGNGFDDVIGRNSSNTGIWMLRNNGDGSFTELTGGTNPFGAITLDGSASSFSPFNVVAMDVNGDGRIDVFNNFSNEFWRNDGASFSVQIGASNPLDGFTAAAGGFLAGDFNGDGYDDLAARNNITNDSILFWRNNGNGTWEQRFGGDNPFNGISFAPSTTHFNFSRTAVLDADGDGDLDIYDRQLNVLFENGATLPDLISSVPAPGAIFVSPSANIVLSFSESVNLGSGTAGTTNAVGYGDIGIYNAATNTLIERINVVANAGRITGVGTSTVTIDPVANLPGGADIYVLIGSRAFVSAGTGNVFLGIDQADVFTFSVTANAAPVLAGAGGTTAAIEQVPVAIVPSIFVSDSDDPTLASATVSITGNFQIGQDVIGFANGFGMGNIGGSYNAATGVLTLTSAGASATTVQWQTALRAVTYTNTSDAPNTGDRTVSLVVNDGMTNSNVATQTLTVAAVNDAPTITNAAVHALAGTNEDTASSATPVSAILAGVGYADADGPSSGIAVTGVSAAGTWQYNAGGTWVAFGPASDANAILLSSTTSIRYIPNLTNGETASFSFRAWDGSAGTASTNGGPSLANASANGGSTSFSAGMATASMTVTDVNDAPVLADGAPSLAAILEDSPAPTNGSLTGATQLASILGGFSDVDTGALRGAAITAVSASGTLWYSLDAGANWTAAPAISTAASLLLRDTDHVYFQPNANVNGGIADAISYRGWDRTSGVAGGAENTAATGATTAFSAFLETASVTITPVNDAPILTAGGTLAAVAEDSTNPPGAALNTLVTANDAVDGATVTGFAVVGNAATGAQGSWQYSTDGTTWFAIGPVGDDATALALSATSEVRFLPAENFNGPPGSLTVRALDASHGGGFTDGATRVTVDTTANGGTTAISAATGAITTTITAVNDLPVFGNLNGGSVFVEGGPAALIDADVAVSDIELNALNGGAGDYTDALLTIARQGGAAAQDVLAVATGGSLTVAGANVSSGGSVIATLNTATPGQLIVTFANNGTVPTTALVNEVMRAITYANTSDDPPASVTLDWTFSDGNTGNAQGSGANPGSVLGTATVTITPVNDPPTLAATGANPNYVEGAAAATLFTTVALSTVEAGQTVTGLSLSVTNVGDGAAEILRIGGVDLALTNGNSLTVSGGTANVVVTGSTATVTVTGTNLTSAAAQAFVEGLGYRNGSDNPTTGASRVVTLTSLTDSGGTAAGGVETTALAIASTVSLTATNDAPVVTAPATHAVTEDTASAITGISFTDADAGGADVTVTFSVPAGTLAATTGGGGALADTRLVTLQVAAVNDAPVLTLPASIAVVEDVASAITGITIADVDAGAGAMTLTLGVASGTLAATTGAGVIVAGSGTAALTLNGTRADLDAFIAASNVTFTSAQDATADVTLSVTVNDGGNTGTGGALTDNGAVILQVTAVNDAPVIAGLGGDSVQTVAGGGPTLIDLGQNAVVSDIDSPNFGGGSLTITQTGGIANGTFSLGGTVATSGGDATIAAGENVSVGGVVIGTIDAVSDGQGGNNLTISLNANATAANVTLLVRDILYGAGSVGTRIFAMTLSDGADAGAPANFTVEVTPNPPTINGLGGEAVTYQEGAAPTLLDLGMDAAVTDPDSANFNGGEIRAAITAGGAAAQDVLSVVAGGQVTLAGATVSVGGVAIGTVSGGSNGNDLVVALNADSTLARTSELLRAIAYSNSNNDDPTAGVRSVSVTIRDAAAGPGAATSAPVAVSVTVEAVNDAPTLTAPGALAGTEDQPLTITGISMADVDSGAAAVSLSFSVPSGNGALDASSGAGVTVTGGERTRSFSTVQAATSTPSSRPRTLSSRRRFTSTARSRSPSLQMMAARAEAAARLTRRNSSRSTWRRSTTRLSSPPPRPMA